tara:strand:- start:6 stop:299 length:294 start_codon:yes stop_codon:yes gene_type:complete
MSFKLLRAETSRVILSVGDIIIDTTTNQIGILTERKHYIDMVEDDIYIWEVKWINNKAKENYVEPPVSHSLEEEGLKLSIVIGVYHWQSINGGTYEP